MNTPTQENKKRIKLETALLFITIALCIGFLGGVFFSAYRMQSLSPMPSTASSLGNPSEQVMDPEHIQQIHDLENKVAESPEDVDAWITLGNAYFDHKQQEKAIHAYKTALKYQPENANVWTDLGVMYRQTEKPEEAIAAFEKAHSIDPTHEISLFNKGIVQMHDLNDPEGAAETWSRLLELNPSASTQSGMMVRDLVEKLKTPQ